MKKCIEAWLRAHYRMVVVFAIFIFTALAGILTHLGVKTVKYFFDLLHASVYESQEQILLLVFTALSSLGLAALVSTLLLTAIGLTYALIKE